MKSFLSLLIAPFLLLGLLTGCDPIDGGDNGGGGGGGNGERTVLIMGDSISATGTYSGTSPWPSLLASSRPNLTIVNRSRSGERMEQGAARIEGELASASPDVVVIFYGSNNVLQGQLDPVAAALRSSIRAAKAAGASRVVVCTIPRMYGDLASNNESVRTVNNRIRNVAGSEGARVANVFGEFSDGDGAVFPDGLHPNQDGQRIIMVTVREKI